MSTEIGPNLPLILFPVYNIEGTTYKLDDLGDIQLSTNAEDAAPIFFKKIGNVRIQTLLKRVCG